MGECNHCSLTRIRANAKRKHKVVSLNPKGLNDKEADDLRKHGWQVVVYVHDRDKQPTPGSFVAAFMALSDQCEC